MIEEDEEVIVADTIEGEVAVVAAEAADIVETIVVALISTSIVVAEAEVVECWTRKMMTRTEIAGLMSDGILTDRPEEVVEVVVSVLGHRPREEMLVPMTDQTDVGTVTLTRRAETVRSRRRK